MAGLGIVPTRGWRHWERDTIALASTCSAKKGSLVKLSTARLVAEFTSVDSQYLGVILADSANSTPSGYAVVAIPNSGARAIFDVPTGLAASAISRGQAFGVSRLGDTSCSYITDQHASVWSCLVEITGALDNSSGQSRIECAFIENGFTYNSISSTSLA